MEDKQIFNDWLKEKLLAHYGHDVEIAVYANGTVTLEDMDTNEIILDSEIYTIIARTDIDF